MSSDTWVGILIGVIAVLGTEIAGSLLVIRLLHRADMAEERVHTGNDFDDLLRDANRQGDPS